MKWIKAALLLLVGVVLGLMIGNNLCRKAALPVPPPAAQAPPPALGPPIDGTLEWGTVYRDHGTANHYVVDPEPKLAAYMTGLIINFIAANENTSSHVTLQLNGLPHKLVYKNGGDQPLAPADIFPGQIIKVIYDGKKFIVLGRSDR